MPQPEASGQGIFWRARGGSPSPAIQESHRKPFRSEREYVARFAARILELYPACPHADADAIARHACEKYSGRVGRSAAAKQFDARAITLAVQAHISHQYTEYEELLGQGLEPFEARPMVADKVKALLYRWRGD